MRALIGRCRFSLRTFLLTIGALSILLGVVPAVARWQSANWSEYRGQIAISRLGGTFTMASADRLRRTGEMPGWLYRRLNNRVSHVDLSVDAWARSGGGQSLAPVANQDLVVLDQFVNLRSLNLRGASLTDDAVDELAQILTLEELNISDTQITASGEKKLQAALPNCRIIRR
jgi:hypothetical protein